MSKLIPWPDDLVDFCRVLFQLDQLVENRSSIGAPKSMSGSLKITLKEQHAVKRALGLQPPPELVALAALGKEARSRVGRRLREYEFKGTGSLGAGLELPEWWQDDEQQWTAVVDFDPFWLVLMELDANGKSDRLPEVQALGLSGPEDLESPRWWLCLSNDTAEFALLGPRHTKHDEVVSPVLRSGTLAGVLGFALDAMMDKLPSLKDRLSTASLDGFILPSVMLEEAKAEMVTHPKFGRGRVLDRLGEGDEAKVMVEFEGVRTKLLLARFVTNA